MRKLLVACASLAATLAPTATVDAKNFYSPSSNCQQALNTLVWQQSPENLVCVVTADYAYNWGPGAVIFVNGTLWGHFKIDWLGQFWQAGWWVQNSAWVLTSGTTTAITTDGLYTFAGAEGPYWCPWRQTDLCVNDVANHNLMEYFANQDFMVATVSYVS